MDCRKPLILFAGLLAGVGGCSGMLPDLRVSRAISSTDERNVTHKAPTYVAFGDFRAQTAEAPEQTPAQRQQLREEARLSYLKALEVDPRHLPAYVALAQLHQAMEDHAGTAQVYARALKLYPNEAALWFELGMCLCRTKEWAAALASMREALTLTPNDRHIAAGMGYALARAGQLEEAFGVLSRLDGDAKAHYDLARMLRHVNQPELARRHAEAALAADPRYEAPRALIAELDGAATKGPAGDAQIGSLRPPAAILLPPRPTRAEIGPIRPPAAILLPPRAIPL